MNLSGQCICGAVSWEVKGDPVAQFYCHCKSCQKANASPMLEIALFFADNVSVNGKMDSFSISKNPHAAVRHHCSACGARVLSIPGGKNNKQLRAIFPVLCNSTDWFQASMHIYYQDRRVDVADSLPKFVDLPKEFDGSGEMI